MTAAGPSIPYFRNTPSASAKVVGSGTVGPEPITAGSSPGTSEISRLTTRAGWQAAPSLPPLMAERCLRTAFDLADGGARAQQRAGHRLLVLERDPRRRQGEKRRAAAGDEAEREVVGAQPPGHGENARRRLAAPPASGTG